ncbi:hypothetical protein [Demequina rhizosphaerae]|uniref:hypothetical protein n=1 Tax=Demequina rhizosphaerae TaxID=1638985 RepID=UPI000A72C9CF|nr:hypothetical protein [Demequina rhizosphaerae]
MPKVAVLAVVGALVLGALLSACAPGPYDHRNGADLGVPGAVVETVEGVEAYPACGNEPLTVDGTTWYPFTPSNLDEFPEAAALATPGGGLGGGTMRNVLPAVAEPGPGDDVGTLTVYEGGFAYWASDSGDIRTLLTDQEIEYNWVC